MSALRSASLMLLVVSSPVACNMVTGADGVIISDEESEQESSGTESSGSESNGNGSNSGSGGAGVTGNSGSGAAGATGPATTGSESGASTGSAAASGTGASNGSTSSTSSSSGTTNSTAVSSSAMSSSASGGQMCGGAGPGTTPLDSEEQAFMVLINNYRAQNNLGPLTPCVSLNRAAQGHSEDMRDNDYFSHTGLDNSTPWARSCDACFDKGCGPTTAMAENIAAGNSGAQGTFTQWQNSPGHNANMLAGSFTMIGVGRATGGGTYGTYWTNVFAGSGEPSCQ